MSSNIWHSYHPLAGPEYFSSSTNPVSCTSSQTTSRIPTFQQKTNFGNATAYPDRYLIRRPQFCFTLDNDASRIVDVVAYNDPRFRETTALIPSFNMIHPYYVESLESRDNGGPDELEEKASLQVSLPDTAFNVSALQFHDQLEASPRSPTLPALPEDRPASPIFVTPKLESEESCIDSLSLSLTLSPYAPMPLPPIFTHESGSKVMHIPIDTASSFRAPFGMAREEACEQKHHEEKCAHIDPSLDQSSKETKPDTQQFARGSTMIEPLWPLACPVPASSGLASLGPALFPSASSAPTLAPADRFLFPDFSEHHKDIPLEVAESQAAELRATGTNVSLTPLFLLQFLGQPKGQTKWHCYIRGCGKQLTRKGHMMDHVRMHLGERSFSCEHCSQTFLRKADCKRHAATHNPTKGYPCDSCPKSYARKDLLTRHTRICPLRPQEDCDPPLRNGKKRKGIYTSAILNDQSTHDTSAFVNPDMLCLPQEDYEDDRWSCIWGYDEDNKENIDPSSFPSGPMFGQPTELDTDTRRDEGDSEGRRRKRMKTRL